MLLGATFAFPRPSAAASSDLYPRLGCAAGGAVAAAVLLRRPAPAPAPTTIVPTIGAATVSGSATSSGSAIRHLAKRFAAAFFAALVTFLLAWSRAARIARDALARAERSELGLENAAKELKSALMDLEVLRLALAEAEAKALAESEARVDLEARLARETARASSLADTVAARDEKEASAASAAADTLARAERSELGLENAAKELKSALMDLEVLRLALAEAEAKALAESEARVDLEARLARETARASSLADTVAARDEKAAKELKSALMDLEALRLALAEAEAKALAESEARVDLEARLARETARASSLADTVAARDEKEASASSAAADTASSLLVALEDERRARADLERRVEEMRAALADAESRLADAESRLARASKERDVALTERDIALRRAAMASASAQRSQSASAGVSIARDAPEMPVRFELRGVPDVEPGYRVVVAGTWCDWDLSLASPMSLELDDDTGTRYWAVDVDIRADDTYEYKYAVTRVDGVEDVEDAKWQTGHNRVLALQFSLARDVALVEVEDRWRSDPKASPILLHHLDGTIEEIGSTQLLRDCIAELRATVRRLGDAVSAADAAAAEEEKRVADAIVAERAAAAAAKAAKAPASGAAVARAEKVREERLAAVDVAAGLETGESEAREKPSIL